MLTRKLIDQIVLYYCEVNIRIFIQSHQWQEDLLLFLLLVMVVGVARLPVVLVLPLITSAAFLMVFLATFSLDSDLLGNSRKLLFSQQ